MLSGIVLSAFGPKIRTMLEPVSASTTRRSSTWRHTDDMHAEDPVCLLDQLDLALGIQICLGP
jgi:hypothetical protein